MAYSLPSERPVIAAWPLVLISSLHRLAGRAIKARRDRLALTVLLEMDDYRLWDLGISRNDLTQLTRSDDFDIGAVRDRRRAIDVWPPR